MNYKILLILIPLFILLLMVIKKVAKESKNSSSKEIPPPINVPSFLSLGGVDDPTADERRFCQAPTCQANQIFNPTTSSCENCPDGKTPDLNSGSPPVICSNICPDGQRYDLTSKSCIACGNGYIVNPNNPTLCSRICSETQIYKNNTCQDCRDTAGINILNYMQPNNTLDTCVRKCDKVGSSLWAGVGCFPAPSVGGKPQVVYKSDNTAEDACLFTGRNFFDLNNNTNTIIGPTTKTDVCKDCGSGLVTASDYISCISCPAKTGFLNSAKNLDNNPLFDPCEICGLDKKRNSDGNGCGKLCDNELHFGTWGPNAKDNPDPNGRPTDTGLTCAPCGDDNVVGSAPFKLPLSTLFEKRNKDPAIPNRPRECGWIAYKPNEIWRGSDKSRIVLSDIQTCTDVLPSSVTRTQPSSLKRYCKDFCDEEDANGNLKPLQTKTWVPPTSSATGYCNDCTTTGIIPPGSSGPTGPFGPGYIKGVDSNNKPNATCRFACNTSNNDYYDIVEKRCKCCPYGQFPVSTLPPPGMPGNGGWYGCSGCSSNQYRYFNGISFNCITSSSPFILNMQTNANGALPPNLVVNSVNPVLYDLTLFRQISTNADTPLPTLFFNPYGLNTPASPGGVKILLSSTSLSSLTTIPTTNEVIYRIEWSESGIQRLEFLDLTTGIRRTGIINTGVGIMLPLTDQTFDKPTATNYSGLVGIFTAVASTSKGSCVVGVTTIYRRTDLAFSGISENTSNFEVFSGTRTPIALLDTDLVTMYGIEGDSTNPLAVLGTSPTLPIRLTYGQYKSWANSNTVNTDLSKLPFPYNQTPINLISTTQKLGYLTGFWATYTTDTVSNTRRWCGLQGGSNINTVNVLGKPTESGSIRCDFISGSNNLINIIDVSKGDATPIGSIITSYNSSSITPVANRFTSSTGTINLSLNGTSKGTFAYTTTSPTLANIFGLDAVTGAGANLLSQLITVSNLNIKKLVFTMPSSGTVIRINIIN